MTPTASMGPRIFIRGNRVDYAKQIPSKTTSFNGATNFHSWKPVKIGTTTSLLTSILLQWGHEFSFVETWVCISVFVIIFFCFNGATNFHSWKHVSSVMLSHACHTASMGPRIFIRGNQILAEGRPGYWDGFNGATNFHSWKHDDTSARRSMSNLRFNGATNFHSWKHTQAFYRLPLLV